MSLFELSLLRVLDRVDRGEMKVESLSDYIGGDLLVKVLDYAVFETAGERYLRAASLGDISLIPLLFEQIPICERDSIQSLALSISIQQRRRDVEEYLRTFPIDWFSVFDGVLSLKEHEQLSPLDWASAAKGVLSLKVDNQFSRIGDIRLAIQHANSLDDPHAANVHLCSSMILSDVSYNVYSMMVLGGLSIISLILTATKMVSPKFFRLALQQYRHDITSIIGEVIVSDDSEGTLSSILVEERKDYKKRFFVRECYRLGRYDLVRFYVDRKDVIRDHSMDVVHRISPSALLILNDISKMSPSGSAFVEGIKQNGGYTTYLYLIYLFNMYRVVTNDEMFLESVGPLITVIDMGLLDEDTIDSLVYNLAYL